MDQLEQMPLIRSNAIHALEKFADLMRITVVKLKAEGKDGELGDGTLHSLMVKKLPDRQLENFSRWLNEREREKSVTAFRDWLKSLKTRSDSESKRRKWLTELNRILSSALDRQEHRGT